MEIVVDGSSLFTRCWYATVPQGAHNNAKLIELAISAASKSAISLFTEEKGAGTPTKTSFCWEGSNKRVKKKRVVKPDEFYVTRDSFKKILEILFGTINVISDNHEADDTIATIIHNSTSDEKVVASGDKDLKQLIDKKNNIYYYCLINRQYLNTRLLETKYGIKNPIQLPIYLAIVGDSVDEIPGIPKWGDKKSKKLFEDITYEDGFTQCLEKITQKIRKTGDSNLNAFYESLNLTLLEKNIPYLPPSKKFRIASDDELSCIGSDEIVNYYRKYFPY